MLKKWKVLVFGTVLFFPALPAAAESLPVGRFSAQSPGTGLPEQWEPLTFPNISKHTDYALVTEDGQTVVKAVSEDGASGLIRRIRIDPETWPVLSWRWKVSNVYKTGDVTRKQGDDYPARIYVTFQYEPEKFFALNFGLNKIGSILEISGTPSVKQSVSK